MIAAMAMVGASIPSSNLEAGFTPNVPCDVNITQSDVNNALAQGTSYLIANPGKYCLAEDVTVAMPNSSAPFAPITIDAVSFAGQGVVLDLQQHRLQNTTAGVNALSFSKGVFIAPSSSVDFHIVNGTIAGFGKGVAGYNIAPFVPTIDNLFFDNNVTAIDFYHAPAGTLISNNSIVGHEGINLDFSNGSITVENNMISLNAGMWHAQPDPSWVRAGLILNGPDFTVVSNDITLYASTNDSQVGILSSAHSNFVANFNTIRNARFSSNAIWIISGFNNDVQYNNIYSDKGFCLHGLLPPSPPSPDSPTGLFAGQDAQHINAQNNVFVGAFKHEIIIGLTVNSGLVVNNTFYFPSLKPITNDGTVEVGGNWYEESCVE